VLTRDAAEFWDATSSTRSLSSLRTHAVRWQVEVQSQLRANSLRMVPELNGMRVYVNDFQIDAYESGAVSQFYSDLSVQDRDGNELYRKAISVRVITPTR
jgi:cytochrome c biogenesis protein ResB